MAFLTDFADQAVMLPLAAAIGLALAMSGWWRGCAAWILSVVGVLGTMAVLKVAFFACASVLGRTGIHSPSGHTASAAMIMGGALVLWGKDRMPAPLLAAVPVGLAVLFGLSRLAVHAHSVPEVLAGGAVGLLGVAMLWRLSGPRPALRSWPAALAAVCILAGLHGLKLHAESAIHGLALFSWLPVPATCRA